MGKKFLMSSTIAAVLAFGIPTVTMRAQQTTATEDAKKAGQGNQEGGQGGRRGDQGCRQGDRQGRQEGREGHRQGDRKGRGENEGRGHAGYHQRALQGRHDADRQDQDDGLRRSRRQGRKAVARRLRSVAHHGNRILAVMRTARLLLPLYFLIVLFSGGGHAQSAAAVDPSLLGPLRWRSIGPANTGGRIDDFAIARVAGQPDAVYVAAASGGVFKSTNQGTSWTPIFDRVDAMMSIGAIASAPANPAVVWVGTGEANNRQSSSWGDGVYKSVDAGVTWTACRPSRHAPHRPHRHSPVKPRRRVRGGRRPLVGAEQRTRRLQDHRRRTDLDEGPVHRRQHRARPT